MSALRRAAIRTGLAVGIASGLAGAAAAQFKIEPMGDWDRVSIEHLGFFVAAMPNTRAARGFCIWDKLAGLPHVDALKADPDVMKAGLAPDLACIILDCKPQGHRHDAELTVRFNAPPLADRSRLPGGVSMAMRFAGGETPIVLFERAQRQFALSRDGNFELGLWETSWPRDSAERNHVRGLVLLTATDAFLDRIAAQQKIEFVLEPWAGVRDDQGLAHDGRTVSFSLARMADVLGALRANCAERRKRRN